MRADVYSYGNIVAFCVLGLSPWQSDATEVINFAEWNPEKAKIELPKKRSKKDPLSKLIVHCYALEPEKRPENGKVVLQTYFSGKMEYFPHLYLQLSYSYNIQ